MQWHMMSKQHLDFLDDSRFLLFKRGTCNSRIGHVVWLESVNRRIVWFNTRTDDAGTLLPMESLVDFSGRISFVGFTFVQEGIKSPFRDNITVAHFESPRFIFWKFLKNCMGEHRDPNHPSLAPGIRPVFSAIWLIVCTTSRLLCSKISAE